MTDFETYRQGSKSLEVSPRVMYEYETHQNIPWNIKEYQPLREYFDYIKAQDEKKYQTQKKGQPDERYNTKRGFYMDYHLKVVGALPAPSEYKLKDGMD